MYDIPHFKASNHQQVIDFMQANPFVTICGVDANGLPVATHIPVLIDVQNDKKQKVLIEKITEGLLDENDLYEKFKLIDHDNDDKYIDIKNLKISQAVLNRRERQAVKRENDKEKGITKKVTTLESNGYVSLLF